MHDSFCRNLSCLSLSLHTEMEIFQPFINQALVKRQIINEHNLLTFTSTSSYLVKEWDEDENLSNHSVEMPHQFSFFGIMLGHTLIFKTPLNNAYLINMIFFSLS